MGTQAARDLEAIELLAVIAKTGSMAAAARDAMMQAGPFKRVLVMASDPDPAVLRGTLDSFEPAVPVTTEGAATAAAGVAGGWAFIRLIALPFGRRRRGVRAA